MEKTLVEEIRRFVAEDERNRLPDNGLPIFEEPLVGFAAADDPLFARYKQEIGDFLLNPQELLNASLGSDSWRPVSVICWVLPISTATKKTNRQENLYPSKEWAHTRTYGENFNVALRKHIVEYLIGAGSQAAAPMLLSAWRTLADTSVGLASNWSERHAAYAAGLGTFSLNDALITPRGIAHRLGTVLTDRFFEPSPRFAADHRANCLFFRENTCGLCVKRCPVGALSERGHDKKLCHAHVYTTIPHSVGERYQVKETGCGLCQTGVPCEGSIPVSMKK